MRRNINTNNMANKYKDISNLSISELRCLYSKLIGVIESEYKHVADYVPSSITKAINNEYERICKENDRRDDEI